VRRTSATVASVPAMKRVIQSPTTWCLLITIDFVFTANLRTLVDRVGDPDDAARLLSVRELLHGAPWFDTTLPRIGAPVALISHWSRLVDTPLALLIGGLTPLLGSERAELLTRIVWPVMLLFALQLIVVREARRRGGVWAAGLALVFAMTSITASVQFSPGRIDHHNAIILCTIGGLLFLERSMTDPRAGWSAGVLLGLALAIGYEPIALILPALAAAALVAVWTGDVTPVTRAVTAATVTMSLALVATVRSSQWIPIHCDALAINAPLAFACCAVGLWVAGRAGQGRIGRVAIVGTSALVAVALFAALEPACLRGPFAQVSPEMRRLWMDHVLETKSVLAVIEGNAPLGWSFIAFAAAGAIAQIVQTRRRPDAASVLASFIAVVAFVLGCWQVKLMPYASWFAAMSLAVYVAHLGAVRQLSIGVTYTMAAGLLSQATLMAVLVAARGSARRAMDPPAANDGVIGGSCLDLRSFASLSQLPPGLVAGDLELGPYIAVATNHRVVAAPYHRLEAGILANQAILAVPPDEAVREIRRLGVNYVALCQGILARRQVIQAAMPDSLEARLLRNEPVGFLNEVTDAAAPIRIWSVRQ
jgi:hypothetical protein